MEIFDGERESREEGHSAVPVRTSSQSSEAKGTEESCLDPQRVFIRSFVFHPSLPIRIDYEAKGFKTEMVYYAYREGGCVGVSSIRKGVIVF